MYLWRSLIRDNCSDGDLLYRQMPFCYVARTPGVIHLVCISYMTNYPNGPQVPEARHTLPCSASASKSANVWPGGIFTSCALPVNPNMSTSAQVDSEITPRSTSSSAERLVLLRVQLAKPIAPVMAQHCVSVHLSRASQGYSQTFNACCLSETCQAQLVLKLGGINQLAAFTFASKQNAYNTLQRTTK